MELTQQQKINAFLRGMSSTYDVMPIDRLPAKKKEALVFPELSFDRAWENVGNLFQSSMKAYEKEHAE